MNSTPPTGVRSVWLAAIALACVFAVGGACGVLADRVFRDGPPDRVFRGVRHFTPDAMLESDLSDEQRKKMEEVFERHRAELDALMQETEPQVRALGDRIEREVDAILTPEQRERLKAARWKPGMLLGPRGRGVPGLADRPMPGMQGRHIIRGAPPPPASGSSRFPAPAAVPLSPPPAAPDAVPPL